MTVRSVGVEEELLLVEPRDRQPRAVAEAALRGIRQTDADGDGDGGPHTPADEEAAESLDFELQLQQLETNSGRPAISASSAGSCAGAGR